MAEINKLPSPGRIVLSEIKEYGFRSEFMNKPVTNCCEMWVDAVVKLLAVAPNLDFVRGYIFLLRAIIHNLHFEYESQGEVT